MSGITQYLAKQKNFNQEIDVPPTAELGIVVVIPAYKEKEIVKTLRSLKECKVPKCDVELIVFINGRIDDDETTKGVNISAYKDCLLEKKQFSSNKLSLHVFCDLECLPKKAGVGMARKRLMDEACLRLEASGKPGGVIVNLDADCKVATNYLLAIEDWFEKHQDFEAASIHYGHLIDSQAILKYELHLRYFVGMQKAVGLPFAFQTVGSAMACRALAYAKVGGMNSRKAGEDFYFLHKFIKNETCGKITDTCVFPSGRVSDRVPFGTGRAIGEMEEGRPFKTYNYNSFIQVKKFISQVEDLYEGQKVNVDIIMKGFLRTINFDAKVLEIRQNTSSFEAFRKRFFQFFDAFKLMKCLHFLRDQRMSDESLNKVLPKYFDLIGKEYNQDMMVNLETLRKFDKTE